jgi:uncharacterized protein (TIGR00730 family)
MKVAVFCSSSHDVSPMILSEMERVGSELAAKGHDVVYGGCSDGCMGTLARGVLGKKGRLIGVIPQMDFIENRVQEGLSEQHVVPTLSSRKEKMIQIADAFVVFPGGIGTLDEALEVLALKSLGGFEKPIFFYNFLDLWTPFLEALELMVQQRLIRHPLDQVLVVLDKPETLSEHLERYKNVL